MSVRPLTEHHLEFRSLKGDCTCSSESVHVKKPHCWKSHFIAHFLAFCSVYIPISAFFREQFFKVTEKEIGLALREQRNVGFRHVYNSAVVEGYCTQLMETLDTGMADVFLN